MCPAHLVNGYIAAYASVSTIGLDSGTLCWVMLEKLWIAEVSEEWTEIWNATTVWKVSFDLHDFSTG